MSCANNDEQCVRTGTLYFDEQPVSKGQLCHVRTVMRNLWEKGHNAMCEQWWATCEKRVIMPCANDCEQPVTRVIIPCVTNDEQSVRKGSLFHVRTIMSKLWEKGHYAMCEQWIAICKKRDIMTCMNKFEQLLRKGSSCHGQTMISNVSEQGHYTLMSNLWVKVNYAMCEQWCETCEKRVIMPCANNDEQPVRNGHYAMCKQI